MNNLYTTVDISGGLGSQLFQLAFAIYFLRLSKKQKIKRRLVFKEGSYKDDSYLNTIFKGLFRVIPEDDYNKIAFDSYHSLEATHRAAILHKYIEPPYKAREHIKLNGYYKTFKYIEDTLREKMINIVYSNEDIMYSAYYKYRDILNYFGDNTKDDDMVSLHIRRGDYLSLENYNYNLDMSYYKDALNIVKRKNVVIFSDDIEWCINYFADYANRDGEYNIYYVSSKIFSDEELASGTTSVAAIEFVLMSMFKHNIIANSYFSLWASFISYYKTKIVVAPKRWYSCDGCKEYDELYHKYITHII
uniref:Glycosyltransferase n=1 Tax=viral metagenome TaxID=1070528 RepID=A0A6C0K6E1_9ZZZZ